MNKGQQELIRFFDENPNMKQASLADLVGCGKSYINRMVKGTSKPGRHLAGMIEHHTGVSSYYWDIKLKASYKDIVAAIKSVKEADDARD